MKGKERMRSRPVEWLVAAIIIAEVGVSFTIYFRLLANHRIMVGKNLNSSNWQMGIHRNVR